MHYRSVENGMVIGAQDVLDDRAAHADREAKAFEMLLLEFLDALRDGPHARVSWYATQLPLGDVVGELLSDEVSIAELVAELMTSNDVRLHLANRYAGLQVAHYAETGSL